jgi:hypothetical protein
MKFWVRVIKRIGIYIDRFPETWKPLKLKNIKHETSSLPIKT